MAVNAGRHMEQTPEISKRLRIRLWLIAWGVALAATPIPFCIGSPGLFPDFLMSFWAFPIGTAKFVFPAHEDPPPGVFTCSIVGGWIFYIALTIYGLSQRRRARYFVVYAILCLLLILNAVGCNVNMLKGHFHI